MKRFLYTLLILFCFAANIFADGVTLTTSAPSTVEAGDKFRVQFTVNTQGGSNFSAPDFKGFEVIYGPSTSSQSSISIINGRTTQSSSVTYTFVLLGSVAGNYTIGPASVVVDGKTVKSSPVKIKVLPIGQGGGAQGQQGGGYSQGRQSNRPVTTGNGVSTSDLFMTATASRTNVFEQEAILLTYKIYTTVNLTQLDGKLPTLDGFQIQEIPLPRNKEFQLEQYNGRNYRSVIWSQYVLFPQKSGDLVIPSITYEGVVITRNRNIDPIEAFFNGTSGMQEMKKQITTPRLTIHVSPLPAKPANYSGAVGKFELSSSISTQKVNANDAVTLKLNVKGVGNMKLINTPEVQFPKGFESYDPKVNDKFSLTRNGLSGSKEFEYLVVPRNAGEYTIPATPFVFFDPSTKSYKTLYTEPYTLKVKKTGKSSNQSTNYGSNQQDVKELNQDIRYIKKGDVTLHDKNHRMWGTTSYLAMYGVAIAVFILALVIGRKRIAANNDVIRTRGRKANKMALKRMRAASKFLKSQSKSEFYDEVLRALLGYAADKLNIPQEQLNKDNIQSSLAERGVAQEHIDAFMRTLNDCEFARYAPDITADNMETVYNNAIDVISNIEKVKN